MVLAAGLGTRLRPLTDDRPKALVDVGGRPLITYNLALLRHFGITDVVVNLHHHGDKLRQTLGDGTSLGLRIAYSPEDPLLDTGGGIKHAEAPARRRRLPGAQQRHDHRPSARSLASRVTARMARPRRSCCGAIRSKPVTARSRSTATDRIRRFLGTPERRGRAARRLHVRRRARDVAGGLSLHAGGRRVQHHARHLSGDAGRGRRLYGFPFAGFWRVIDTPADRERAHARSPRLRLAHVVDGRQCERTSFPAALPDSATTSGGACTATSALDAESHSLDAVSRSALHIC